MTFEEKIKELRKEKEWTQEVASEKMGISISALRYYENGRLPDTVNLKKIKEAYDVPYEYLLDDNCENRIVKNIKINKYLGLSDKAIANILSVKDSINAFNEFLEKNDTGYFFAMIHYYNMISEILEIDIARFAYISCLAKYIKRCVKEGNSNELIEYFDNCDKSIEKMYSLTSYVFFASNSIYDLFIDKYMEIKNYIFNTQEFSDKEFDILMEEFVDLIDETQELLSRDCRWRFFEIDELFRRNIDNSSKYNIHKVYEEVLGKYIKEVDVELEERRE